MIVQYNSPLPNCSGGIREALLCAPVNPLGETANQVLTLINTVTGTVTAGNVWASSGTWGSSIVGGTNFQGEP